MIIVMLGVDLVHIPEFKKQLQLGGDTFLDKTFNKTELQNMSVEHLAGIWAAKEAVFKASEDEPDLKNITIKYLHNKPYAELNGVKYQISISHHNEYAVAVALGEYDE